ncbi:MAG: lamin tail domain-containing protein, partial [Clostridia bacterium]|nr:lamin tail domain-containing protein [Clostridia bacterium]
MNATKKRLLCLVLVLAVILPGALGVQNIQAAPADHVVINQVFGGGGKGDSRVSHSFIQLYNPTASPVNLTGWKILYHNNGDGRDGEITLAAILPAGEKYLIKGMREAQTGAAPILHFAMDASDCNRYIPNFVLGNKDCQITLYNNANAVVDGFGRGMLNSLPAEGAFAVAEANKHTVFARTNGVDTNSAADFTAYNFNANGITVMQNYTNAGLLPAEIKPVFAFANEYVKADVPLTVTIGQGNIADYRFSWTVNNSAVAGITTHQYTPKAADMGKLIGVTVRDGANKFLTKLEIFYSDLPVLYINTENLASITSKDDYVNADMRLQGNDRYNNINTTLYNGPTEIKGRGNSTWQWDPKKPFKLKLDAKVGLFGWGPNKHWVLITNYTDPSFLRDKLAYDLTAAIGGDAYMESTWLDMVQNGRHIGMYRITEHVRVSPERVNIYNWEDAADDAAKAIANAKGLSRVQRDKLNIQMNDDLAWAT